MLVITLLPVTRLPACRLPSRAECAVGHGSDTLRTTARHLRTCYPAAWWLPVFLTDSPRAPENGHLLVSRDAAGGGGMVLPLE